MKKAYIRLLKLSAVLTVFLVQSCNVTGPSGSAGNPSIVYTVSGGFAGGTHTRLTIDPEGLATLETTYPQISTQLSAGEYMDLLRTLGDFGALPDTFPNSCFDGFIFTVETEKPGYYKRVSIDQCTLYSEKDSSAIVAKIENIIVALDSLARKVYDSEAPWKGLTAEFSIDSSFYGVGEPITLRYRVSNPTSVERAIYFRHRNQFTFSLDRYNFPSFYFTYPQELYWDSSATSELHLAPGESKEITYEWNQRVQTSTADSTLGIGYYSLRMNLLAGDFQPQVSWFEIIDRRVPIAGFVTPDPNGSNSGSPTYTFALTLRNRTSSPVTLHFPSSARISVELYDVGGLSPRDSVIFRGPAVHDSTASNVTLSPYSVTTFSYPADKSAFGQWYLWTYAKIKLLCTDFDFSRDAELMIAKYSK